MVVKKNSLEMVRKQGIKIEDVKKDVKKNLIIKNILMYVIFSK